jgi:bifunctional non-homologous end joining protein LigD
VVRAVLAALDADERPAKALDVDGHAVALTRLDRVYWPADAALGTAEITKRDLLRHLVAFSPRMLPHVVDRPLTLFRWPEGIVRRRLLQKHPETRIPPYVATARIFSDAKGSDDTYLLCNNLATLVWLGEMGALEIHVWHSRVRGGDDAPGASERTWGSTRAVVASIVERPDYLLFDLDPYIYAGDEAPGAEPRPSADAFRRGKEAAFWLKDVLDAMSIRALVKTSGKTGLHVLAPIVRTLRYDAVREVARLISGHLLRAHPEALTTEWDTAKRRGKIVLDHKMNVRGKSIIAPYGTRGLPGAPISLPLTWTELERVDEPQRVLVANARARLKRADPWADFAACRQDLARTIAGG